jgi:tetratricopeptide (TPR) repeat protein/class 3 adenylate cyclase
MSERWRRVHGIFSDAIECPPAERAALLEERCAEDAALRHEVESLLTAHENIGPFDLLAPIVKSARDAAPALAMEWFGRRTAHYDVQEPLGAGGMGIVYRAFDERLGRQVALKFLPPHLSADATAKSRFVAEARAAAALNHPGVCTIYEIGETEDGQLFIAMPLYEGETLQARLDRGRLAFDEALPIALQVARALAHAHDAGIVHRDVKPSNIVLLPDGTAKILDFGIAQIPDGTLTDPHKLIGTISYMSPEHAQGGNVDCRSDVWSLAIVLHEMLTGARPFTGAGASSVLHAILTGDPELTATAYPDVPARIEAILRRALTKHVNERYASMSQFAADLSALIAANDETSAGHEGRLSDTSSRPSAAERRRAAVLVTVISDYPLLVDRLAPAELRRLVALVRDTAVDVVRAFGGLVNQAMGEEIVSLFGVPMAHDDDDLRAVRAALELQARVSAIENAAWPPGVAPAVQSGLHVGPVVARRLQEGPRRYDIVGGAPAFAARLAAIAERDSLLVSPETKRLIGPYMHTAACAPVVLDAQVGPVTPFRVRGETGIATRLEASTPAGLTPYVGRNAELAAVRGAIATGDESGAGAVIAIVGEPGAGKSRLLYELQQQLGTGRVRVLRARCRAYGDSVPYGVFVQILCAALDLRPPLGNAETVVARIRAVDAGLEPFLPLFLHLLSMSGGRYALPRHLEGEHFQAVLLDALAGFIDLLAQRGPVCIVIEDWHWADTGSRAAFLRVAELVTARPLTLIVTSRQEQRDGHEWPRHTARVVLNRLDFTASAAIMAAVLGVRRVHDELARRLYDRAGGNPFFLEQVCASLLETHAVTIAEGEAVAGAAALSLPETVQGVIRARLDNLSPDAVEILRVASVIGREFDHPLLAELVPTHVDLGLSMAALEHSGLIRRTAVAPTLNYRFTHALTQEVCYDSLVGHERKRLHGAIGRALAAAHAQSMDELAARLAHHFGCAEEWPAAIRYGRRAAERAIALSQFTEALRTLDQVLDWVGRLPRERQVDVTTDLQLQQERLCETLGLRARQQQIIDSLIARLAGESSSLRLAQVYLRQGDLSTLLKRFDAADRALGTALRIAQDKGDRDFLRSGLRSLGLLRWHEGRHAEAADITRRVLAIDRECHDDGAVAGDLTNLGNILRATGDFAGARRHLEVALAMPILRRDPKKLVYTGHNLANVHRAMGDLDRALACLLENDKIAHTHLMPIQRSFHLTSIAHIHLLQGRIDVALETYRAAVDLSRRARHADGLVQCLRMLGNALLGLARYDEALPCLEEAAQLFAQLEDRAAEAEMWTGIARVREQRSPGLAAAAWTAVCRLQRSRGDAKGELDAREGLARATRTSAPQDAVDAYTSALSLAAMIGEREREAAIRNVLGILEWERGEYVEALRHYESALVIVRELGKRSDEALILNSLGVCLIRLGRRDEGRTVLEQSLALSRGLGERQLEAHALAALGHALVSAQDFRGAAENFEASRAVRHGIGDLVGEGWMSLRLAEVHGKRGDRQSAVTALAAAEAAAAAIGDAALTAACAEAARVSPHS